MCFQQTHTLIHAKSENETSACKKMTGQEIRREGERERVSEMWIINNGFKCETKRRERKKRNWWRYEWKCRDVADSNQELINRTRTKQPACLHKFQFFHTSDSISSRGSSCWFFFRSFVCSFFSSSSIICGVYFFHYKYLFVVLNLLIWTSFFPLHSSSISRSAKHFL